MSSGGSQTEVICGRDANSRLRFAGVNPEARFVEGRVCDSRFAAKLAPYPSRDAALEALRQMGAVVAEDNAP